MEARLSQTLQSKIASFDISKPYVWRLKISEKEFNDLESWLSEIASVQGTATLAKTEYAIATIIYIAEWYKRRYQSGNKNSLVENLSLETLWDNVGISQKLFLYRDDSGNKRWLYSTYVLGGLATMHEMNRNDKMKFLKGLCRIYHGENYTLENLDEASRAIAFRESIKRQHSLYEYMKEILNGEMPFHQDDLSDDTSIINRFVATIKAANDEILKVKFRFEWNVTFSLDYNYMARRLYVWFKPEEVGGGLHQYLRYDRVHLWGVPNPEKQPLLYVFIRFKKGDEVIEPSSMDKPIITYLNHSVNDFVAFGSEKCVLVKSVPTVHFDKIEIIVKDAAGNEYLAQTQDTEEYIQLWRSNDYGDTWTSTQNAQKQTALVFSNRCKLKDECIADEIYRKSFRNKLGESEIWNWIYIYDSVTLIDNKGKEVSLYNRIGYDQVTTRLYTDTIHYVSGGNVKYYYIEDPDISENYEIDEYPLIFGWDDIIVRHFATKDDIKNARPDDETAAELIEYKQESGRYTEWTSLNEPCYGKVTLRVTVKGKSYLLNTVFLPKLDEQSPIKRDFETTSIRYKALNNEVVVVQDEIPMDGNSLNPTLQIRFGKGDDFYEVDVYRPTLIKEVLLDGNIIEYLYGEEKLELPYIFKERVQLNDFNIHGYQAYECKNLCNIYTDTYLNITGNDNNVGMAALSAWTNDTKYHGKLLDAMAPESLLVCFGRSGKEANWLNQEALVWNYDVQEKLAITEPTNVPEFGIIFQNLTKNSNLTCNYPILNDDDPWGFDDVKVCIVRCFEVANETGTYFFLMKPLVDMQKSEIIPLLYEPLLRKRNGELTIEDKQGLIRFAEEFGFAWQDFKITFVNE